MGTAHIMYKNERFYVCNKEQITGTNIEIKYKQLKEIIKKHECEIRFADIKTIAAEGLKEIENISKYEVGIIIDNRIDIVSTEKNSALAVEIASDPWIKIPLSKINRLVQSDVNIDRDITSVNYSICFRDGHICIAYKLTGEINEKNLRKLKLEEHKKGKYVTIDDMLKIEESGHRINYVMGNIIRIER